ncbi:hypothetical protein MLD38_013684 [Melastoma candidum]|uniref:Uncharacterized protein n=1 Tax=Melastoma candidum TaxID=119954 RepID=A0ACB9RAC1_9MYRT|nr:hypothetical protein MLD38_013684 [Melastoma candidum]
MDRNTAASTSSAGAAPEDEGEVKSLSFVSMDSVESSSRWVFQDEDDSDVGAEFDDRSEDDKEEGEDEEVAAAPARARMDSEDEEDEDEDEENDRYRLIRTGPRLDSFDVEAFEVPGAQRNDYEVREVAVLGSFRLSLLGMGI